MKSLGSSALVSGGGHPYWSLIVAWNVIWNVVPPASVPTRPPVRIPSPLAFAAYASLTRNWIAVVPVPQVVRSSVLTVKKSGVPVSVTAVLVPRSVTVSVGT